MIITVRQETSGNESNWYNDKRNEGQMNFLQTFNQPLMKTFLWISESKLAWKGGLLPANVVYHKHVLFF